MLFNYDENDGLKKGMSEGIQIDVISDLHLDFYITNEFLKEQMKILIENFRMNLKVKQDNILIVAGDIAHHNSVSSEFLSQVSKIWQHVLVIPGNHDWYLQNKETEDRYLDLRKSLVHLDNLVFLMDEVEVFEYEEIKIAGTLMFYNLNEMKDYVMWKSILNDKKFLTREFINKRNEKDVKYYNKIINDVDIFVSHVPIVNLDGKSTTENLFLNMDVNPIKNVLYLSGHTHRPKNSVDLKNEFDAINIGYGYPSESNYKTNAITSIFFKK